MNKLLTSTALILALANAQSFEEFKQQNSFKNYKKEQVQAFNDYKALLEKEFQAFRKEVGATWKEPKITTPTEWVEYSKDKKTRKSVDFEKGLINIEIIEKDLKRAKAKIKKALEDVVSKDTIKAHRDDELGQRIKKALVKKYPAYKKDHVNKEPILFDAIFDKAPTKQDLNGFTVHFLKDKNIKAKKSTKVKDAKVYTLQVKLPSKVMVKKSQQYLSQVKKNAKRFEVTQELIFAIIHSESSFNPMARSYVPAFGLMQIVPKTAGIDAYNFLHKRKKLVSPNYLYNSTNNIQMGSAYLHILYYKYMKNVKDPTSRLYCAIAAYNTGAGNVARAFSGHTNILKASAKINRMSPEEVYNYLLTNLPYDETKRYLKKVSKRLSIYKKLYS